MSIRRWATLPKLGVLGALYFAQGLPFGYFTQNVPVLLREREVSLSMIGLSSLLAIPWALKFLWAPRVDRTKFPKLGRRTSWILSTQIASVVTLLALALLGDSSLTPLLMGLFLLNLLSATQDIATDGFAIDSLKESERGLANGLQVAGYRVGMIVGGGVLLIAYEHLGARGTFLLMALLVALSTLPLWLAKEPNDPLPQRRQGAASAQLPHFLRRPGALSIVALAFAYKFGDAFAQGMLRPLLIDHGVDRETLGWTIGTAGSIAGLVGALGGGALMSVIAPRKALVLFGSVQALSVFAYAALAQLALFSPLAITAATIFEHVAGGMATAALFTCMMRWCQPESAATDYTVLACSVVIATGLASALSGFSAELLGYVTHFVFAGALAIAGAWLAGALYTDEAPAPQERGGTR